MVLKKVIKISNSEGIDSDPLMVYNRVNYEQKKRDRRQLKSATVIDYSSMLSLLC